MRLTTGARDIAAERERQIVELGYDTEHDQLHPVRAFAQAAKAYLGVGPWPFAGGFTRKTGDYWDRDDLVRAGAMIAAAIDRYDGIDHQTGENLPIEHLLAQRVQWPTYEQPDAGEALRDNFVALVKPLPSGGWSVEVVERASRSTQRDASAKELLERYGVDTHWATSRTEPEAAREIAERALKTIRTARCNVTSREAFEVR